MPGLPGLAALARRLAVSALRRGSGLAAEGRALEVRGLRPEGVCDGRHDLRQDPHAADRVVHDFLADGRRQGRGLRHADPAGAGTRLLPDGLGDAAPLPLSDGRPGRDRLRGDVEVDESFLGGPKPGIPGPGASGKVLFAGAVELEDIGFGRARLAVIPDASASSLETFPADTVEPSSSVITDGWASYPPATRGL